MFSKKCKYNHEPPPESHCVLLKGILGSSIQPYQKQEGCKELYNEFFLNASQFGYITQIDVAVNDFKYLRGSIFILKRCIYLLQ